MQNTKEKFKYLFLHFLSPKEIILIFSLLFVSFIFFLVYIYKSSSLLMTDRIIYSGSISEGSVGSPKNINPFISGSQTDNDLSKLLYSSLIKNVNGKKYDLALANNVEESSDGNTYKVTLRNNIYFSNGTPITADDILYSLENINTFKNYEAQKTADNILTFKIKKQDGSNFLEKLDFPIVQKNENFSNNFSVNQVTSSFFKIKNITKDPDGNIIKISLERFNNGENKIPYLRYFDIVYYKNDIDTYNAWNKKEIDLTSGISGSTIAKTKDDTNIKVDTANLPNNFAIFLNQNSNEILRDNNLRQALSDIIDRSSLTNQVLGSFGVPEENIGTTTTTVLASDQIIKNLGSSFSLENGVLYISTKKAPQSKVASEVSSKKQVAIKITTIQNPELEETAKFISRSWAKIGVQTTITVIPKNDLNAVVKNRDFESLLFGFSIKKPQDYYSFFSSKERNYPKLNISNYTNIDADKILETLNTEPDHNAQQNLIDKLSKIIATDNPVIILYKPQFIFAHFLKTQIKLPDTINTDEERYSYIEYWYTDTEKVLSIFSHFQFINSLDKLLY